MRFISVCLLLAAAGTISNARVLRSDDAPTVPSLPAGYKVVPTTRVVGLLTNGEKVYGSSVMFVTSNQSSTAASSGAIAAGRRLKQTTDTSNVAFLQFVNEVQAADTTATAAATPTTTAAATPTTTATATPTTTAAAADTTTATATPTTTATATPTTTAAAADTTAAAAADTTTAAATPTTTTAAADTTTTAADAAAQQQAAQVAAQEAAPVTPSGTAIATASSDGVGGCQSTLAVQNAMRAKHGAAALTWSSSIAATAQAWADGCSDSHSGGAYGENIAYGGNLSCENAVDMWLAEESLYQAGDGFQGDAAHYSQIVWKSSSQVGCGYSSCGGSGFVVCNYNPPGNYVNAMDANVS